MLFDDPDVGRAPAGEEADPTWSVGELAEAIGGLVQGAFPREIWVRGEIHDLSRPASGHVYFTLVDSGEGPDRGASLGVMLASSRKSAVNRTLKRAGGAVRMTDGTDVRVRGRLDWYAPRGQLQLRMTAIDPAYTLGELEAARAALIQLLREEGLLDANASRPMPLVPLRVGLVTSAGSAAEADFLHELERSGFAFELLRMDVRVQGLDAPIELAAGIRDAAAAGAEVIALVRGGGARTDLQAFDDERVARAIATCPVPVVTGIGHETDRSVADEVAHRSEKTPTACAQAMVSIVGAFDARLVDLWDLIGQRATRTLREHQVRLDSAAERARWAARTGLRVAEDRIGGHADRISVAGRQHIAEGASRLESMAERAQLAARNHLRDAQARISNQADRVEQAARSHLRGADGRVGDHATRLRRRAPRAVLEAEQAVAAMDARLRALDPERALQRGWSITRRGDGTLVRSPAEVGHGDDLVTTVAGGSVRSKVSPSSGA